MAHPHCSPMRVNLGAHSLIPDLETTPRIAASLDYQTLVDLIAQQVINPLATQPRLCVRTPGTCSAGMAALLQASDAIRARYLGLQRTIPDPMRFCDRSDVCWTCIHVKVWCILHAVWKLLRRTWSSVPTYRALDLIFSVIVSTVFIA